MQYKVMVGSDHSTAAKYSLKNRGIIETNIYGYTNWPEFTFYMSTIWNVKEAIDFAEMQGDCRE